MSDVIDVEGKNKGRRKKEKIGMNEFHGFYSNRVIYRYIPGAVEYHSQTALQLQPLVPLRRNRHCCNSA
jgi:hypothetical protein